MKLMTYNNQLFFHRHNRSYHWIVEDGEVNAIWITKYYSGIVIL